MEFEKIYNKGQARLFQNQYLEYLTKTHPLVIWGMYMPVLILFPYYSSTTLDFTGWKITLLFLSGTFFWTFMEYVLHRFVFHHHPETEKGRRIVYVLHGNHHEYPRDKERLFMPAVPSLIIASCGILYSDLIFFSTVFSVLSLRLCASVVDCCLSCNGHNVYLVLASGSAYFVVYSSFCLFRHSFFD